MIGCIIGQNFSCNLHYEKFANGSVKCIENEIPFELPEGWAWSKIGPLCEYITSGSRGWAQFYSDTGSIFLRMGNLSRDSFELRMDNLQRVNLPDNAEGVRTRVTENDLLFSITAEIGMLGLIPANFEEAYINQHVGLIRFHKEAQTKYFPYILISDFCRNQYYTTQSGMKNSFRLDNIQNVLIPVPPLAEQIRIVEKLSCIWTQIQQIDSESTTARDIILLAKTKILDLAIRGQLVPQDPADEPASVLLERIRAEKEELIKQGKLKRDKKESVIFRGEDNSYYEKIGYEIHCINEEMPFEIPDTWEWMRLENCCIKEIRRGKSPKYIEQSGTLVFAQKCNTKYAGIDIGLALYLDENTLGKYTDDEYMQDGDVVINSTGTGTLGRVGFYRVADNRANLPIVPDSHVTVVRAHRNVHAFYLYAFMKANQAELEKEGEGSTNQKELKPLTLKEMLIPIPPFSEQKRIALAITAAFSTISAIEKSLT
jgi:type I restriction enzyme S subunit